MIYVATSENNKFKFKVRVIKKGVLAKISVEVIEENIPHFDYPTHMSDTYVFHSVSDFRSFITSGHLYLANEIIEILREKVSYDMYMSNADVSDQEIIISKVSQTA